MNTMKKNNLKKNLTPLFNLKNLEPVYSRLLNKNIDLAEIKKVNSETQIVLTSAAEAPKSLKLRVLDITKLNENLNILSSSTGSVTLPDLIVPGTDGTAGSDSAQKSSMLALRQQRSMDAPAPLLQKAPAPQSRVSLNELKLAKYLKTISNFESEIAQFKNIVYNFNNNKKNFKLNSFLNNSLYSMKSIIGTPVFDITPNSTTINLFYYLFYKYPKYSFGQKNRRLKNIFINYNLRIKYLKKLSVYLSKKMNKPIVLDLTKLSHFTLDSQISANVLAKYGKLRGNFEAIYTRFFAATNIKNPTMLKNFFGSKAQNQSISHKLAEITGIRLKLGGRLSRQAIVPRRSSMVIQKGNLHRSNTDIVTTSRFTTKSRRGAFSITVTMGHKFY